MSPEIVIKSEDGQEVTMRLSKSVAKRIAGGVRRDVSHNLEGDFGDSGNEKEERIKLATTLNKLANALSPAKDTKT
jgi:hypothetical protein